MNFGHHPDPAVDFVTEVDAIQNDMIDRAAGMPAQIDNIRERVNRAMQFNVGGSPAAVVAKRDLRLLDAAFRTGSAVAIAQAVERITATIVVEGEPAEKLREAIAARVADLATPTVTDGIPGAGKTAGGGM